MPDVLASPRCRVASGRCPAPRPQPRALLPPPPGPPRNEARSRVWSPGLKRLDGWVRSEPSHSPRDSDLRVGPRLHRRCRRRPSVTSVPAAAAAAAAAAESQSQTLALLRSHRRQRSLNSHCSRLLSPARRTLPAPDPPLGPRQLPVPAAPAAPPCSSQPPPANRRRCRRRRQGSDCLRQPGTAGSAPPRGPALSA